MYYICHFGSGAGCLRKITIGILYEGRDWLREIPILQICCCSSELGGSQIDR